MDIFSILMEEHSLRVLENVVVLMRCVDQRDRAVPIMREKTVSQMVHSADTLQNFIIVIKYRSLKYPKACHFLEKLEMDTNIFQK